jgi:hypothetical protein
VGNPVKLDERWWLVATLPKNTDDADEQRRFISPLWVMAAGSRLIQTFTRIFGEKLKRKEKRINTKDTKGKSDIR